MYGWKNHGRIWKKERKKVCTINEEFLMKTIDFALEI